MSDRLDEIFRRQGEFAKLVTPQLTDSNLSDKEREKETEHCAYCLIRELTELVEELNYRRHVLTRKPINREKLLEEYIDVLKYYINIGVIWGITPDMLFQEFERKSTIVETKFADQQSKIV